MKKLATILVVLLLTGFSIQLKAQTAIFGGTLFTNNDESNIRIGGQTLLITLDGDTWIDTLGGDNISTTRLLASISGSGNWSEVATTLNHTNVDRLFDTLIQISLPPVPGYDIYADEIISVNLDASILITSVTTLSASPNLIITHDPITASLSGNITMSPAESDIRGGSHTLIISVSNDNLVSAGPAFDAIRTDILAGITGNRNWSVINSSLNASDVVRTNNNTITIDISAVPAYFIESTETVSVNLPSSALANGNYNLDAGNFTITNEDVTLAVSGSMVSPPDATEDDIHTGGETIILTLTGDEWVDDVQNIEATADLLFAGISGSAEWNSKVSANLNTVHIVKNSESVVTITLPALATYDINVEDVISIVVPNSVLKHSTSGTVSGSPSFSVFPLSGTVSVSGTIFDGTKNQENDIKSGGSTIVLTISEGIWEGDIGSASNASTAAIISSITGNRDWATVSAAMNYNHINLDNSQTITITLPAAAYNIYTDETLTINVDAAAIQDVSTNILASPTLTILHDPLSAVIEGSVLLSKNESSFNAGGDSIVIKMRNDIWDLDIGDNNTITSDLLSGITGNQNWNLIPFDFTDVHRRNDSTVTIIIPPAPDYFIGSNETVTINIPDNVSERSGDAIVPSPNSFTINDESVSFALSGDLVTGPAETEADIRAGGKTLIITVNGDEWDATVDANLGSAKQIFDEITGSTAWNSSVTAYSASNLSRAVDKKTLTITFPPSATYDINTIDNISIDIIAATLKWTNSGTFSINNAFSIEPLPASISTSGNIQTGIYNKEDSIRAGGCEIIFTLAEDEWEPLLGTNDILTANLISGISGGTDWETKVKPAILGGDQGATNVNVVGNVVRVTIPAVSTYNILSTDVLSCEIPASCLVYKSSGTVTSTPAISILPAPAEVGINDPGLDELTVDGAVLTLTLKDETFIDAGLVSSNFVSSKSPEITVASVLYLSPFTAQITLSLAEDFDVTMNDFSITVNAAELTAGAALNSNNISITAQLEPEITGVSIDNSTYIIDDVIIAEITVVDDNLAVYEYLTGTIAGRSLDSLKRQSNTLYYGYLTVNEGGGDFSASDNIPVAGLQFNNLPLIGEVYTGVVSSSTIIDASKPVINYMQVSGNSKKIGDQIDIIVSADGNNYAAIAPTSVNSVVLPDLNLQNLGNGVYILKYTIGEGELDVVTGDLDVRLTLEDQAGNISDTYTSLPVNTISIDAHRPQITTISVTNGIYSINDIVEIVVSTDTDGANYSFDLSTEVNGIPYYSSALTGSNTGAGEYTLYYTVKSSDEEVEPGLLNVKVKMTDLAGNTSALYQTVEPNSLAIYTQKPTANVAGSIEICEDDSALIVVNLSGRFPLKLYSYDGSTTTMHDGIVSTPYKFYVNPTASADYRIDSVLDFNGIKNIGTGVAEVIVNNKTDVEFIMLNTSFSLENDPVFLQANVMGGVFSGPGVISTGGIFNPAIADTTDSPHTLYYEYATTSGCVSYDSIIVFVLGDQGDIFIPKLVYCDYSSDFIVQASNTAGSTGSFVLLNSSKEPATGLIDNLDNSASVSPTMLDAGVYTVEYTYDDAGAFLTLRENFTIESVETPKMDALEKDEFCQSEESIDLKGDPGTAVFSATAGVTGNINAGFKFNPQTANLGQNTISYTNTTVNDCVSKIEKILTVNFVPNVQFLESDVCITSDETIIFENQTPDKHTVSGWSWNFGDPYSFENNFSTAVEGSHKFTGPGSRTIKLVGITPQGCSDTLTRIIDFGDKPDGTFEWTNECFLEGDSIFFYSDVTSENTLTDFNWVFYNSETDSAVYTGTETVYHTFDGLNNYNVKLDVTTEIGCKNEFLREIILKPTIRVSDEGFYFEDFDSDDGRWSTNTDKTYNSWDYNLAEFSTNSGNNSKAWYTKVSNDTVIEEQSWVISPCFDLRGVEKPMISLDIFRDMEDNEGVVLQYTIDNELNWQNVGATLNQGINWFNEVIIDKPAGQDIGWSGSQTGDEWIKAIRYLDELKDKPNVRFKLHYGSLHRKGLDSKGFAFDNIKIGSRTRLVLLENFTNGSNVGVTESDKDVNKLYSQNFSDVVKLEYHTNIGGTDPFNESNVFVPATRSLFYGVNSLPELIIDGGNSGLLTYNTAAQIHNLNSEVIILQSLLDPSFEIGLDVEYGENLLTANVQLKALAPLDEAERILQVVVYEKMIRGVSTTNGQSEFRNVVKDMIPNAAGNAYFNAWEAGESVSEQFRWSYDDVYNPEMLRVAVFVQNDNTKEIYQAATDDKTLWPTAINEGLPESVDIGLYPNPAGEFVYLRLSSSYIEEFKLEVFDNMGRIIEQREWTSGSQLERIDLDQYNQGVYMIRLLDSKGSVRAIKKLAVVK